MEAHQTTLWLVPAGLTPAGMADFTTPLHVQTMQHIQHWVVENTRTARRMIASVIQGYDFDKRFWYETAKQGQADYRLWQEAMRHAADGSIWGLMSEAGMPGIADPGADVVSLAHKLGWKVQSLIGPSSIFLALALSGFNGQQFTFHGYLPVEMPQLQRRIRELESESSNGHTQIFIETPYRTRKMLDTLLKELKPDTHLAVSAGLGSAEAFSYSGTVRSWTGKSFPEGKIPAVFLIGFGN
jgi:16S rRNA (cytidine1402-2'-O)-methyltransferase